MTTILKYECVRVIKEEKPKQIDAIVVITKNLVKIKDKEKLQSQLGNEVINKTFNFADVCEKFYWVYLRVIYVKKNLIVHDPFGFRLLLMESMSNFIVLADFGFILVGGTKTQDLTKIEVHYGEHLSPALKANAMIELWQSNILYHLQKVRDRPLALMIAYNREKGGSMKDVQWFAHQEKNTFWEN